MSAVAPTSPQQHEDVFGCGGHAERLRATTEPPSQPRFTSQQIVDSIRRWTDLYGAPPTTKDWEPSRARAAGQLWRATRFEKGDWPSLGMVVRQFGTFNAAIRQAGFEPHRVRAGAAVAPAGDRDWILRAIVEWTRRYGAPPTQADWDPPRARRAKQDWRAVRYRAGQWPRLGTVRRHFGSLAEAIELVGLRSRRPGTHGRIELGDRDHNLHVLASLAADSLPQATASDLAAAIKDVAAARRAGDAGRTRGALLDLASVALRLADDVGWGIAS